MAKFAPEQIRNIAILGHSHDGKTTLAEALLYAAGAIPRMGGTDAGTSTLDFEPEEQKHNISIGAGIGHLEWRETKVNLVDCPGFSDFGGEVAGRCGRSRRQWLLSAPPAGSRLAPRRPGNCSLSAGSRGLSWSTRSTRRTRISSPHS